MASLAISHIYHYPFESRAVATSGGVDLRLATSGGSAPRSEYFRGQFARPQRGADLLRGLVEVVGSRFHDPSILQGRRLAMADPVVTCGDQSIRFEVFSGCCGVYARVDFLPTGLDGERSGRGTTNVDFNAPMRAALARVRDSDTTGLAIGAGAVELTRGDESVVERKVKLPVRWLRGFVEVQMVQSRMTPRFEVAGAEAVRFLRGLPRSQSAGSAWVVPSGRGLRLSQSAAARDGLRVGGINRLQVLATLARHARTLRVHADPVTGASAWELDLGEARFHLVVSPDPARGFSGEGQALEALVGDRWGEVLPRVQASLRWGNRVDPDRLASEFALDRDEIRQALAALGSRGLVGFDLGEMAYFHRELPFDLSLVDTLHPRLQDARMIVAAGGVRVVGESGDRVEAFVQGTKVEHRVILTEASASCTCPWFAQHEASRGPCKHLLAAQLVVERPGSEAMR